MEQSFQYVILSLHSSYLYMTYDLQDSFISNLLRIIQTMQPQTGKGYYSSSICIIQDNDISVGKSKKKRSKMATEEEENDDKMDPVLEHKKNQFPGLCIADDPKKAEQLTKDTHVAQQAMGEVRNYTLLDIDESWFLQLEALLQQPTSSQRDDDDRRGRRERGRDEAGRGKDEAGRRRDELDRDRRRERRSRSRSQDRYSRRGRWDDDRDRRHHRRSRSRSRSSSPRRSGGRWDKSYQQRRPSAPVVSEVSTWLCS